MAATIRNASWIEETRKKIQTSQLINRLQDHALGVIEMTATQIKAAETLIRKTIPDLQAVTISGDAENPLVIVQSASQSLDSKLARVIGGAVEGPSAYTH